MPFRKWYGCLGELRSLIPTATRLVILTATATKATKEEILNTLHLSGEDIKFIEQSPDRPNIKYCAQYLDKNEPLEASFSTLIEELKTMRGNTQRTLIYCQTRKQCSVLFLMFEVFLGHGIFQGTIKPQNCHSIFTLRDVSEVVEIWRQKYAVAIINILSDIFGDIDTTTELPAVEDEAIHEQDSILSEWGQLRDDSSLNLMLNTFDLEKSCSFSEISDDQDDSHNLELHSENSQCLN